MEGLKENEHSNCLDLCGKWYCMKKMTFQYIVESPPPQKKTEKFYIYSVFIKYCVFPENIVIFLNSVSSATVPVVFDLALCTHTRQVENQRCSRTYRVQKNHKILR